MPNKPFSFGTQGEEKKIKCEKRYPQPFLLLGKSKPNTMKEIISQLAWAVKTNRRCGQITFDSFAKVTDTSLLKFNQETENVLLYQ